MSTSIPPFAQEITTALIKTSQTANVVRLYNRISTHIHKLTKAVSAYEKDKANAIAHFSAFLGIPPTATDIMAEVDPKFKMLVEVIALHNAYALELREFEEGFRKEWKRVKGGSLERRVRFLDGRGVELGRIRAVFEGGIEKALVRGGVRKEAGGKKEEDGDMQVEGETKQEKR